MVIFQVCLHRPVRVIYYQIHSQKAYFHIENVNSTIRVEPFEVRLWTGELSLKPSSF